MSHWPVVPVLLPLFAGAGLLLLERGGPRAARLVSLAATAAGVLVAARLVAMASGGGYAVYRLGDWAAPFGIVLVVDRLGAFMVLLTAVVALFSAVHAARGADAEGPHYHALFQLQLAGLNGAFLTGDLFNLFVFFELLLIASYCLLVHGGAPPRLRAGVHYVVLNLAGSALFLIAVGVLYGLTGTLNMADLSVRVAALGPADAGLARAGALLLLVVFALKAALVPLHLWLPSAYAAASAPVAALFAIMTKVGVYCIVRVYTLVFGPGAGVAADVAAPVLLPLALATIAVATLGALASGGLRRMQGYLLIASVGMMLAAVGLFSRDGLAAGLYYLAHSTVTMAAMFLLADVIARRRGAADDRFTDGPPLARPAVLGSFFFAAAVAAAGVPPFSGFLGKVLILRAAPPEPRGWWLWGVVLGGSLLALITLARAGSAIFWHAREAGDGGPSGDAVAATAMPSGASAGAPPGLAGAAGLLGVVVLLTALAGPASGFTAAIAEQLLDPGAYVRTVLGGR